MKSKILTIAALAFTVYAQAQTASGDTVKQCEAGYSYEKMAGSHSNKGSNSTTSVTDPKWVNPDAVKVCPNPSAPGQEKVCYKMVGHKMFVVTNGTSASMREKTTLQNGTVVMMNGAVVSGAGTVYLKNGESIDMQGMVATK
jgi:hypothetical protein